MSKAHDASLNAWLVSLEPRRELAVRLAMRGRYPEAMAADRLFGERVDELLILFSRDPEKLALIIADASDIERNLDALIPRRRA